MFTKRSLYYMTAIENIESIASYGIMCRNLIRKIPGLAESVRYIDDVGVNHRRGLRKIDDKTVHDYVPLYWATHTPMQYRITEKDHVIENEDLVFVVLKKLSLLKIPGIWSTDGNAASWETRIYPGWNAECWLDERVMNSKKGYKSGRFRIKSAEVLVPKFIPFGCFDFFAVRTERARQRVLNAMKEICNDYFEFGCQDKVRVQSSFYFR